MIKILAISDGSRNGTLTCLNHKIMVSTTKIYCVPFLGEQWCVRCPEHASTLKWKPISISALSQPYRGGIRV